MANAQGQCMEGGGLTGRGGWTSVPPYSKHYGSRGLSARSKDNMRSNPRGESRGRNGRPRRVAGRAVCCRCLQGMVIAVPNSP